MNPKQASSPLDDALRQFEAAEANLAKLERCWRKLRKLVPDGIVFGGTGDYDDLCREFRAFLSHVPAIDGFRLSDKLPDLNQLAQNRIDALELGEPSFAAQVELSVDEPGTDLAEYRFRFDRKRRELIRAEVFSLMGRIDAVLPKILEQNINRSAGANVTGEGWETLAQSVSQIGVLLGSGVQRPPRWGDLNRHIHFAEIHDLTDIVSQDWPDVRASLTKNLFGDSDPIPVEVADLGQLVDSRPRGPVATRLMWSRLSDEDFERLLFQLFRTTAGYENGQWLMKTNAPDRGRDLSVDRVVIDPLIGTSRSRVIVQCRHWQAKSVSVAEVATLKEQIQQWEPPLVRTMIIATSGRFTSDAVHRIEQHNGKGTPPIIEMWPESHLESLLVVRPDLLAEFKLR